MLESALVILPLLALTFALLDFTLAIFIQNTLRNAVREGVRYAVTQQTGAGGQDQQIKNVVFRNSFGFVSQADIDSGKTSFKITYYDKTTLNEVSGPSSNAGGNICVITAVINTAWMAPLWRATGVIPLSASSSDVMEAPPNGIVVAR